MSGEIETEHFLGMKDVGAWFGVPGTTVAKWIKRYADDHPCPTPNVMVGERTPGWLPDREDEWREWEEGRPGRGAGGGRPRRSD